MQSELHRNNVYQSVKLLLLVPMLFLKPIKKMVQTIEHSTLCCTGQTAVLHRSSEHNRMKALGMLIHGKTNFVLALTLYLLDCHRRRDIRPSHPCACKSW